MRCLADFADNFYLQHQEQFLCASMSADAQPILNRFLLNLMQCRATNETIRWCVRAIAALFTVAV